MIGRFFKDLGAYMIMFRRMFRRPENFGMLWKRFIQSCYIVGVQTLPIIIIISFCMGMVMVMVCEKMIDNPVVPPYMVGMVTREILLLELTPTGMSALIACVVGFRMTFYVGNLRMNEQIDALETMGINTASFIVFPFVLASFIMVPCLLIVSIIVSLIGGWFLCYSTNLIPAAQYLIGLQFNFQNLSVEMLIIKSLIFSILISTIAGFCGYSFSGTIKDLSKRSTYSITLNCIVLIIFDYIITSFILQ